MTSAAATKIFFMALPRSKYLGARRFDEPAIRPTIGWLNMHFQIRPPRDGRRICVLQASLRRGLGVHVDDLDAAVDRVHRRARILRLGLAIADGDEIGAIDAVFLGEGPIVRIDTA